MAKTYLQKRLSQLKITKAINTIPRFIISEKKGVKTYKEDEKHQFRFFEEQEINDPSQAGAGSKKTGNVVINYFEPDGRPLTYVKPGTKLPRPFQRTRLANPEPGQPKYLSPKGAPLAPFFTPKVIAAFQQKETIETLILTEGEFKAFKGDMAGLYIVGLPGIQGFYSGEIKGEIHFFITRVLKECNVKNVIYLTDADTFTINFKKDQDMAKRPASFLSAIENFAESLQSLLADNDIALQRVYFYAIRKRFCAQNAKGLDDLLQELSARTKDILDDLLITHGTPSEFFEGENLTKANSSSRKLYKRFGLTKPEDFYNTYKEFINEQEFVFKGRRYQFDGEKVIYVRHEEADKYMRVGPHWYKEVQEPMGKEANGEDRSVTTIQKWVKSEIKDDYKNYKDFMDQIARYDGFTVEPRWNGKYRRRIGEFFNLMNPIDMKPRKGEFPMTRQLLTHLFQGEGSFEKNVISDPFTVALDWLTILHTKPTQMLPVPILVSEEKGTGKTTFMDWLTLIYGSNALIMNNETFKMNFNSHYASKFLLMVDEGMLEVEKKAEKERLKQLVTGKEMLVQFKGADIKRIPYFGKVVMCSNDADRVMKMEEGDSRWFVVKVPVIPKGIKDPQLLEKLMAEIPAWLHYLTTREIAHPYVDRLWFSPENFITDQFKKIVLNTKSRLEKLIDNYIKEAFLNFKQAKLKIPVNYLTKELNKMAKFKTEDNDVRDYLKKRGLTVSGTQYFKFPIEWIPGLNPDEKQIEYVTNRGRCLTFDYEDWVPEEDLQEFNEKEEETVPTIEHNGKQLPIVPKEKDEYEGF
jgi:Family of unknown function (DUF5906)